MCKLTLSFSCVDSWDQTQVIKAWPYLLRHLTCSRNLMVHTVYNLTSLLPRSLPSHRPTRQRKSLSTRPSQHLCHTDHAVCPVYARMLALRSSPNPTGSGRPRGLCSDEQLHGVIFLCLSQQLPSSLQKTPCSLHSKTNGLLTPSHSHLFPSVFPISTYFSSFYEQFLVDF